MFSTVLSATLRGLCVEVVQVEADSSNGLPIFHMVGYLSSEVKEAGERVRTAIHNSGFYLPAKRIVVNLSPANMRKKGTMFDLPIAIAVLASLEMLKQEHLKDVLIVGELGLDGTVRYVPGVLPIVLEAKKKGYKMCIVPKDNEREGNLAEGICVVGVTNLKEVCQILSKEKEFIAQNKVEKMIQTKQYNKMDYANIKGQKFIKRAVEIAVSGNHNILMVGPPGAGKSLVAKCIPTILPPLTLEESMELTMIYSIVGGLNTLSPLVEERPFREVHHSVTSAALIGGGILPRPGEISLAHKGVLFLDEFAEFHKPVLEMLRQPLEEHKIKILRERGEYEFPAEFLLVAAMNPCPCGNYPDLNKCVCTTSQRQAYLGRISQPILDRIDMCVEVEKVKYDDLSCDVPQESSAKIRERVLQAREIQKRRYQDIGILTNAQLGIREIKQYCKLGEKEEQLMQRMYDKFGLTARKYHKILTVARTIADMDGKEKIELSHLSEAFAYRTIENAN